MIHVVLVAVLVASCSPSRLPPPPTPPPAKSLQLNRRGEAIDLVAHLVPGYVTVVDFWGEHCGACVVMGGMLAVGVAREDRVLIRKIDVGDGFSPVAAANQIAALPHFRIYDKYKRLRYDLVGNDCLEAPRIARELTSEP